MDTPKGKQIETVLSDLEDSPFFAYINGLSPLKPVKSTPFGQTITWLGSFSSPPSVFMSPVSSRKQVGLLERRHCFLEPSKPELFAGNGYPNISNAGVLDTVQVSNCSAYPQEIFDPGGSIGEAVANPYNDSSDIAVELQPELKYDCGSSDSNPVPSLAIVTYPLPDVAGTLVPLDHHVQDISIENDRSNETKVELAVICQQDQTEGGRGHGKEKLASDVLTTVTEIPKGQNQKQVDSDTRSISVRTSNLPRGKVDNPKKRKVDDRMVSCGKHEVERPLSQLVGLEKRGTESTDHSGDTVSNSFYGAQVVNEPNEKARNGIPVAHNSDPQQQHGIRRRSLVFEISTTHKITMEYGSNSSSITSKFDDKQLVPFKPVLGSSPYTPPGIGLHSNALEATTKNCEVVKHETLASGGKITGTTSSIASFNCLSSEQKPVDETLAQNSTGKMGCASNEVLVVQVAPQSPFRFCEEFNQSSRKKKKRHNVKHDGERECCKGCSCKNSKCLKLYCDCFAASIYCMELCSCRECFNKPPHEDTVLDTRKKIESRDPLAFSPKVIWSSESAASTAAESDRTPTSARHKKGCNCKKSRCLKKYCECYQGGARCSISCRCLGCENGRSDEWSPVAVEIAEQEEEETENSEMNRMIEILPNSVAQKSEEHYSDHIPPQTPSFHICRSSFQLPCSSGAKPQRSEYSIGTSALPLTRQTIESDSGHPLPKFKFHFQITPDKGTAEILSENSSPFTPTQTSCPNSKRVTPPRNGFGLSLGRRTSRKLVLQSTTSTQE